MTAPGLYAKYHVERVDGRDQPGGDKTAARYFVLDYVHDPFAREALAAYANACERELPQLARDLRVSLTVTERREGTTA
jgi:hypothetical protein